MTRRRPGDRLLWRPMVSVGRARSDRRAVVRNPAGGAAPPVLRATAGRARPAVIQATGRHLVVADGQGTPPVDDEV